MQIKWSQEQTANSSTSSSCAERRRIRTALKHICLWILKAPCKRSHLFDKLVLVFKLHALLKKISQTFNFKPRIRQTLWNNVPDSVWTTFGFEKYCGWRSKMFVKNDVSWIFHQTRGTFDKLFKQSRMLWNHLKNTNFSNNMIVYRALQWLSCLAW